MTLKRVPPGIKSKADAYMSYGRQAAQQGGYIGGAGVSKRSSSSSGPKTYKAPKRK